MKIKPEHSLADSILGIDIGSVTISLVQMELSGKIRKTVYLFHKGQIRESLLVAGQQIDLSTVRGIACCTSPCVNPELVTLYNPQVAAIRATKTLCRQANSLLLVGAEKFMLIQFDEKGSFESVRANSSCAAGTGSFLDQQAFRLNLSGIEELCVTALRNTGPIPDIASRCSVFAKTDLIHAQQRGFSLPWALAIYGCRKSRILPQTGSLRWMKFYFRMNQERPIFIPPWH
ncbi:MAG: BadF/BadG/BcrA/BcrD ATPase family protein [Bacteroidota bacterium]